MASNNIAQIKSTWHYNLIGHFFVLLLIFIMLCLCVIIKDNLFTKQIESFRDDWYEYSKKFNLTLDEIVIEGRYNVSKEDVLNVLNLNADSSFLAIDEEQIENKLKEFAWIKSVDVKKRYIPNVLEINIKEKEVIALFQKDNLFHPLDEKGEFINASFSPHKEYIVVTGKNGEKNVSAILKILKINKHLFSRVKALQYISNRRWNVILDDIKNGKIIKLPEAEVESSWKKLIKLNTTHGILKRPLTIIDLRFDNKVIFKLDKDILTNKVKEIKA
ncbi:MAG: FtsQ-type POTRA domain-containing protein [Alphaproteobacteria bacterium]